MSNYASFLNFKYPFSFFASEILKAVKTTHTRRYRFSKKIPRRIKQVTVLDYGNVEQQIRLSFPNNSGAISNLEIKKEKNPNLIRFLIGECSLVFYKDTEKGFVYDKLKFFSGTFEKHDLKQLYSKLGAFFRTQKNAKGYSTVVGDNNE